MKRLFAVIMMLLTILPLAACGNKTDDSTEPDIIGMPNPFTDFDTLAEAEKQTGRTVTKLLSMAACLAVIIIAVAALRSPAQVSMSDDLQTNEGDTPGFVQGGTDIIEHDSAAALSAAVGFEVNDIDLPFTPEQTEYISYWHELAEIDYTGEGKTACYRKAAGTEDCSGDYNVYTDVTEFEAGSITVTLKGDAGQHTLAIWTDGSYSYSLSLSDGLSLSDWQALMNSIQS